MYVMISLWIKIVILQMLSSDILKFEKLNKLHFRLAMKRSHCEYFYNMSCQCSTNLQQIDYASWDGFSTMRDDPFFFVQLASFEHHVAKSDLSNRRIICL